MREAPSRALAHRSRAGGQHDGGALPLILLLMLALTGLGHAAFLVALEEEAASTASIAVLQATLMAEGGVRQVLESPRADSLGALSGTGEALGSAVSAEGSFQVVNRPLTSEIHWLEGVGRAPLARGGPQRVEARVSRVLWALSPVERLRALEGVLEYGYALELSAGAVDAGDVGARGELDSPSGCLDLGAALDSVSAGRIVAEAALATMAAGRIPALGFLEHDSLLVRVPGRTQGAVTPAPVLEGGRCVVDAPDNWGSPSEPGGPCGGHRPALVAEGDLTVAGGEGQGLLVVTGNLRITEGARFAGLLLVAGDLTLDAGARLDGFARVAGRVRALAGAQVSGALCPALLALRAHPALQRPLHLPGGGWIRPF